MAKLENVKALDMVGGEITRISYAGAEYTKVDGVGTKGDIGLRIKHDVDPFAKIGNYYLIDREGSDGSVGYIDGVGGFTTTRNPDNFAYFRKVTATTPPIEERVSALESRVDAIESGKATEQDEPLKVGDYAKVVEHDNDICFGGEKTPIGDIVIILLVDNDSTYKVEELDGGDYDCNSWVEFDGLVRATDEEVAKAKAELAEKQAKEAERKKWAAIGREVGEFKNGDLVRYKNAIINVISVKGDNATIDVPTHNGGKFSTSIANIGLVTPVEQRFDLPEVTA